MPELVSIYEFFIKHGYNWKKFRGQYGIEIETEAKAAYLVPPMAFWTAQQDGSLRDFGIEYVLNQPLDLNGKLEEAFKEFSTKTKDIKFIQDSVTTSNHVHINFLNESVLTLNNFFVTYTLVENLLARFAGENRISNGFCLPICDAEDTYQNMITVLKHIDNKKYGSLVFDEGVCKYAALNLASLARRGSLEIRLFRGTTDIELILTWVRILDRILQYSKGKDVLPSHIISNLKRREVKILEDIFQDDYKLLKHPKEKELLEKNFFYSANLAFAIKDWNKVIGTFSKTPKKPKLGEIDKVAKALFGDLFENLSEAHQREVMYAMQRDEGLGNLNPARQVLNVAPGRRPRENAAAGAFAIPDIDIDPPQNQAEIERELQAHQDAVNRLQVRDFAGWAPPQPRRDDGR